MILSSLGEMYDCVQIFKWLVGYLGVLARLAKVYHPITDFLQILFSALKYYLYQRDSKTSLELMIIIVVHFIIMP